MDNSPQKLAEYLMTLLSGEQETLWSWALIIDQLLNNQAITNQPINNQPINNQLINNQPTTKQLANQQVTDHQIANPQFLNPQLANGQLGKPQLSDGQLDGQLTANQAPNWLVKPAGNQPSAVAAQLVAQMAKINWRQVSPLMLGTVWEMAMNPAQRRSRGAHYTAEKNILTVINSLFMNELWAEFHQVKTQTRRLPEFHQRLSQLKFLDPACGCGNFLVLAYRELRQLEFAVLRILNQAEQPVLDISTMVKVTVDQFYGLELENLPAQIAKVAMWLTEYQLNIQLLEELGSYCTRLPWETSANIVCGNALTQDWQEVIAAAELSYIFGNPPFVGYHLKTKEQQTELRQLFDNVPSAGMLDYAAGWFYQAAQYMQRNPAIRTALVATNSITQGEQVGILWTTLLQLGVQIYFAHRSFQWSNAARHNAAVHCVIIGFSLQNITPKRLFYYDTPQSEARERLVANISPYLTEIGQPIVSRRRPLCAVPPMSYGSKPADGGYLLLSDTEKAALLAAEPLAAPWIRPFVSAKEFLHNEPRWCLWLVDLNPQLWNELPLVRARVKQVQQRRQQSRKALTNKFAAQPTLFAELRQPTTDYLLFPLHFSHQRRYLPLGLLGADWIVGNSCAAVAPATAYHFGVLSSAMHMAWINAICGRLKSDVRYSVSVVYNNFPWPVSPSEKQQAAVLTAAGGVLATRAEFADIALATLYDPVAMPTKLVAAHQALDRAVDRCYRRSPFVDEAARVAFLFQLYEQYAAGKR